jgi:hypothetical protein
LAIFRLPKYDILKISGTWVLKHISEGES